MDPKYFFARSGRASSGQRPAVPPQGPCCWWSGQSWPYATTQTLEAARQPAPELPAERRLPRDYFRLLRIYALTHRKDGQPYLAEAAHPDTGSFQGHDGYNHSEHYFHSGFNDLIITGLAGLKPRADDVLEVDPLAPADWPWFALDDLSYRGHRVSIVWDKAGTRYGQGPGLHLIVDGKKVASSPTLGVLTAKLPAAAPERTATPVNYLVNNDGDYYPQVKSSFTAERTRSPRSTTAIPGIISIRRTVGPPQARPTPPTGSKPTSASRARSIP